MAACKRAPPFLRRNHDDEPQPQPELLDHLVDLLRDAEHALKNRCLISKSWIPRTRKNLRQHRFLFLEIPAIVEEAIPRSLQLSCISCPHPINHIPPESPLVTAATGEDAYDWIRCFSRVVYFVFTHEEWDLVPFHGFSPALKSIRVEFITPPPPQVLDLVLSFPLLEDLSSISHCVAGLIDHSDGSDWLPFLEPQWTLKYLLCPIVPEELFRGRTRNYCAQSCSSWMTIDRLHNPTVTRLGWLCTRFVLT